MKHYHFLASVLVVIAGTYSAVGQIIPDRPLSWIHGYNESTIFWQRYNARFPITHHVSAANSTNNAYVSNGELGAISQAQGMLLPNYDVQPVEIWPIAIGHSMGGIVAREIDQRWDVDFWKFCSMITVGTPHKGVFAIRAIKNCVRKQEIFGYLSCLLGIMCCISGRRKFVV